MTANSEVTSARSLIILAEVNNDVSSLRDALASADHSIRTLALGGLSRLDALAEQDIVTALTDTNRDVRCRAVELAIEWRGVDLISMLRDDDDLVVETAAFALGEREDPSHEVISGLSSVATGHEISICREAAVAALGAIGDEAGLPAILAGLEDRAPVRRRAVLALAPFDTPEVTIALEKATQDRDRQVRQAAEDLL